MVDYKRFWHLGFGLCLSLIGLLTAPTTAQAVPAYARQTGQSCVACHAGGQFPELTPYGRAFKLTGYTYGSHTIPVSVMATWGYEHIANTNSPNSGTENFPKNDSGYFQGFSIFLAGKITDHIGAFFQYAYDPHADAPTADNPSWQGGWASDNLDFRAADRWFSGKTDLIYGATVNNNPTVQDVWNSTPAWGFPYIDSGFMVEPTVGGTLLEGGLEQQAAGVGAYAYWNKTLYAGLTGYQTADGVWSFMSQGSSFADQQKLKGINPYWRVALTHEWGPHNAEIGTFGMIANIYPDNTNPTGPTNKYTDIGFDAQYQYLLDPNTITAQVSYISEKINWYSDSVANGDTSNASDKVYSFHAKGTYIYRNKYGGSLQYFNIRGTSDMAAYASTDPVEGNLTGTPNTNGWVAELDWMPIQYVRVGLQYWYYNKFNGSSSNYDGNDRSATNNNTLFLYVWGAI